MKRTGAEVVVKVLEELEVDTIFGFPGGAVIPLYDVLYQHPGIKHVLTCHEQAAAHAADGYARSTGRPGVCIATSGPGATNLVTGLATAYMDSVPVVAFTGQVPTALIGKDSFQEVDITGISIPVTKHNFLVKHVAELPFVVRRAFELATSGRPGPVLVDLPKDVSTATLDYTGHEAVTPARVETPPQPEECQLKQAARMLEQARQPVIYAGGGVMWSGAHQELVALAEHRNLPVVNSLMGLGTIPREHPLSLGMVGMHGTVASNLAVSDCDLLLAVGARFSDRVTGRLSAFAPRARVIHVDLDPAEIGKNVAVDLSVVGDARKVLQDLKKLVEPWDGGSWLHQVQQWQQDYPLQYEEDEAKIKPQQVVETLAALLPKDAVVATEVGQHQMFTAQYFPFRAPRTLLTSGGLGTMGYGLPAAMGAQAAFPRRTVVVVAGDGSLRMNSNELATAVRQGLNVKVVVMNNTCLGMVRQWQELFCDERYSSTLLPATPDFSLLAEAYGARGMRAEHPEELEQALRRLLASPGPALLDCWVDPCEGVYPMVPPGGAIHEMLGVPGLEREQERIAREA